MIFVIALMEETLQVNRMRETLDMWQLDDKFKCHFLAKYRVSSENRIFKGLLLRLVCTLEHEQFNFNT